MSYLYAVQMNIFGYPFQPIKIGMSKKPDDRAKTYVSGPFPTTWLGSWEVEDACVEERRIHQKFEQYRLYGEWFYPTAGLKQLVERKVGYPIEVILFNTPSKERQAFNERFVRLFPDGVSSIEREWDRPGKAKPCSDKAAQAARERLDAIEAAMPI